MKDRVKKLLKNKSSLVLIDSLCIPEGFPLCIKEDSLLIGHKGWDARPEKALLAIGICTEDDSVYHFLIYGHSNSQSDRLLALIGEPKQENGIWFMSLKSADVDDEQLQIFLANF